MSKQYARRQAKTDPKGDRRSRTTSPPAAPGETLGYELTERGMLSLEAMGDLMDLLLRGDGWVRITATLDMKTVYLKYKYTSGSHRGRYVMAVCHREQLPWGICLLCEKVRKVDAGSLSSSQDTFYDWKD